MSSASTHLPDPPTREDIIALERRFYPHLYQTAIFVLRIALFIIFIWFGLAKFGAPSTPGVWDALLNTATLTPMAGIGAILTSLLGVWEILVGLAYVQPRWIRYGAPFTLLHQFGTFIPLFAYPSLTVSAFPWLSLDGQFVLKNLVIIGSTLILWHYALARHYGNS